LNLIWQGILLGLGLSILVGPMLFLYLQVGIQRGFRAAFFLGLGTWASDFFFILCIHFGLKYILSLTGTNSFKLWMGLVGGIILVIIGISLLLSQPPQNQKDNNYSIKTTTTHLGLWLKGFLINTFNPFAVFFWLSIMTGYGSKNLGGQEMTLLLGGILGTIILTDVLKMLLAKQLKNIINSNTSAILHKMVGTVLVLLGLVLMYRVF
jgi:threonine/homoserine/homoserine lactone efflux protein